MQDCITDEQLCIVLSNSEYSSANKAILDCLIEKLNHTGNLLEFCDYLEKILPLLNDQGSLTSLIAEVRTGTYVCVHMVHLYTYISVKMIRYILDVINEYPITLI